MGNDTPDDESLLIVPVPALVAVLLAMERAKGEPLTQAEVEQARDNAESIVMPAYAAQKVAEARGYRDIDPENVWAEWQEARAELAADGEE